MNRKSLGFDIFHNMQFNDDDPALEIGLHQYDEFVQLYEAALNNMVGKLENFIKEFDVRFDHKPIHSFSYRLKEAKSVVNKLKDKNVDVSIEGARQHLDDIAGMRIICPYIDDVYMVSELLLSHPDVKLVRHSDYIKKPKENGYRSMHLIVEIPVFQTTGIEKVRVEIQIRTIAMDFWAALEHDIKYKHEELDNRFDLYNRLEEVAKKLNLLDIEMQDIFQDSKNMKQE